MPTARLQEVDRSTPVDEMAAVVHAEGGLIIKDFLTGDQVASIDDELAPAMRALAPGSTHDDWLQQQFHGTNTKRLTNVVTLSPTFRSAVIDSDLFHELGEAMFRQESGDWWLTTAQVIEIGPHSEAQSLHRDLENNPPFIAMGPRGPMVIANLIVALTEFTKENGATRIIPGSNEWDDYDDRGSPEASIPVLMDAGDAVFYSGKVLHGGGANVTSDQFRRGITSPMQPAFLTPEEAYPFLVPLDVVRGLSPRTQRILGFRSVYPKGSPGLWQHNYADIADHLGL
jgi:hypothetical protein